jgi:hypothetical protein
VVAWPPIVPVPVAAQPFAGIYVIAIVVQPAKRRGSAAARRKPTRLLEMYEYVRGPKSTTFPKPGLHGVNAQSASRRYTYFVAPMAARAADGQPDQDWSALIPEG